MSSIDGSDGARAYRCRLQIKSSRRRVKDTIEHVLHRLLSWTKDHVSKITGGYTNKFGGISTTQHTALLPSHHPYFFQHTD